MRLTRRKLLWGGASAVALAAGGYKLFRGLEDSPEEVQEIPPRLRGAGLDVHVHAMGVGTGNTGCWMSDRLRKSIQARAGLWSLRLSLDQADLDQAYVGYLIRRIHSAGFLKQVVLLALDWTHTESGERDASRTPFYTPNEYVARLARVGQDYGDPRTLVAPLEEGVTVIAAHVASLGERDGRSNFDLLAEMFPKWPNLYADTSALTLITRWRVLLRLAQRTDLHARLVHGSDFPLPPASTLFLGSVPMRRWWNAWKRENPLRRDFEIKEGCGLPEAVYLRGYQVLAPRIAAANLA